MNSPLFILAPPRSFTSVVCAMIGNHPDMLGLAETNLFAADRYEELTRLYRARPRLQFGLLRTIAELGLGGQSEENVEAAKAWLEQQGSVTTADLFRDLMAWAAPRRLVDKSPIYVYAAGALERIGKAFPDACYLHLAREPRATCESIYKTRQVAAPRIQRVRGGGEANAALTPENMWLKPHLRILEQLEKVPAAQKMFLRGELLLAEPELYLTQITQWLEIRSDREAIEAMLHPEQSPFACYGPDNAPLGNDPNFLDSPELRPFTPKPVDLDSPLSWDNSLTFNEDLKHYATYFGY